MIHHLAQAVVDPQLLILGLQDNRDPGVRQALLLALGLYAKDRIPAAFRDSLVPRLQADYRTDPDSGIHAAIHWLLRCWDHGKELDAMNRELEKTGWNPANTAMTARCRSAADRPGVRPSNSAPRIAPFSASCTRTTAWASVSPGLCCRIGA